MPVSFSFSVTPVGVATAATSTATANALTLPRDLALAVDGDILVTEGDIVLSSGLEAIADDHQCRVRTFLGECFVDTTQGVPWMEEILGERPTPGRLREIFEAQVLATPGLVAMTDFAATRSGRSASISYKAKATTGDTLRVALTVGVA